MLGRAHKSLERLVCQRPCRTRSQSVISPKRTSCILLTTEALANIGIPLLYSKSVRH